MLHLAEQMSLVCGHQIPVMSSILDNALQQGFDFWPFEFIWNVTRKTPVSARWCKYLFILLVLAFWPMHALATSNGFTSFFEVCWAFLKKWIIFPNISEIKLAEIQHLAIILIISIYYSNPWWVNNYDTHTILRYCLYIIVMLTR